MLRRGRPGRHYPAARNRRAVDYPLQRRSIVWALGIGILFTGCLFSVTAGASFAVLILALGLLWQCDVPPVLAFCVALQWLFIVSGFFYQELAGTYPSLALYTSVSSAVLVSLLGILAIVAGLRAGTSLLKGVTGSRERALAVSETAYELRPLFWAVIGLFTANWILEIRPAAISFDAAQILSNVLLFRNVLLFLLFYTIIARQRGYLYGLLAFLYVLLPTFASRMSDFKWVLLLTLIALLAFWKPWSISPLDRLRTRQVARSVAAISVVVVLMALIWQGAVKHPWRSALDRGEVQGSPTEKLGEFSATVSSSVEGFSWSQAMEDLAGRMSSSIYYFQHVLERVPDIVPHENGAMTTRALEHVLMPRILFPDKPNLGGDSWLVLKYAGLWVAGEEMNTSVGLGYMAQLYIDFGIPGMLLPLFLLGLLLGFLYRGLLMVSPSLGMYRASIVVIFLEPFSTYEVELAKLIGALGMSVVVMGAILQFGGPWIHASLTAGGVGPERRVFPSLDGPEPRSRAKRPVRVSRVGG